MALSLSNPDPLASGISGIIDLIRGVSGTDVSRAREGAALADPFASQRPQYQQQLQALLTDPSSFKTDPGYEFALGQGQQAIERGSNAKFGTSRVGSLPIDLARYTEGFAAQNYDQRIQQLLTASGATTGSPAAAGAILGGGYANQDKSLGGGIAGVSQLLESLFGPDVAGQLIKAIGGGAAGAGAGLIGAGGGALGFLDDAGLNINGTGQAFNPLTGEPFPVSGAGGLTGDLNNDFGGGDWGGLDFGGGVDPTGDLNLLPDFNAGDDFGWFFDLFGD